MKNLNKDYPAASMIKELTDENAAKILSVLPSYNSLEELREIAKEDDLNLKVSTLQNQRIIDGSDNKQPVKVNTRYVLTDEKLVSPSGFHPSEHVFSLTNVMIQTNRLPKNTNLICYDMTLIK